MKELKELEKLLKNMEKMMKEIDKEEEVKEKATKENTNKFRKLLIEHLKKDDSTSFIYFDSNHKRMVSCNGLDMMNYIAALANSAKEGGLDAEDIREAVEVGLE